MTCCGDAHNHLQDERFAGRQGALLAEAIQAGVTRWVVNGSCESDWPDVAQLARSHRGIIPSFGCHPWYLSERTATWREILVHYLDTVPGSVVGEVGLDRWILELTPDQRSRYSPGLAGLNPASISEQRDVLEWQWRLAHERRLPVSVHCLKAWGMLLDSLRAWPRLERGFLLHSYGGPAEMIPEFTQLGAYFSFPGYFLHERKSAQRETFRHVPADRLLIETDAPDQLPPESHITHPLVDPATGRPVNHPANLPAIYAGLARFLQTTPEDLTLQVASNFSRLFG